jgi:hypothetical protein
MKGNGTFFNAAAAHKVPIHIIEYLITVHITVYIRSRDRIRMVVI